jgi:hypothetical protein
MYTTKTPIDMCRFNVRSSTLKNLSIFCKRQISIELFYSYQRLQCRDKYFFKIKIVFFLYLRLSASSKENDLPLCIFFWYQTDSGVPNTSIYSAVSLASPYYNYLSSTASTTMICWRCHSNSVNTGSRLPICSNVKIRKRRNVVGIDMFRNNRIVYRAAKTPLKNGSLLEGKTVPGTS